MHGRKQIEEGKQIPYMGVRTEVDAVPITSPIQRVGKSPKAVLHDFLDAAQAGPMPAVHHVSIAPLRLEPVDRHFELQLLFDTD